MTEGFAVLS